jgi:hypothetical protein
VQRRHGYGRLRLRYLVGPGHAKRATHEFLLIDHEVGGRAIGRRRKADGQDRRAPIPPAQLAQYRREIGIGRQHDEFIVMRLVLKQVDDVEHHVDIGTGLAATGQRRTIRDLEAGQIERWTEVLVHLRIEITTAHEDAPLAAARHMFRQGQRVDHPADPLHGTAGKPVGRGLVEFA